MSNEMVERVARALEPKCRAFGKGDMPMQVAREFARAAIEAMRQPTDDMIAAARRNNHPRDIDVWLTMISEALK